MLIDVMFGNFNFIFVSDYVIYINFLFRNFFFLFFDVY